MWKAYAEARPYVAPTAEEEAACTILRNRDDIVADAGKRNALGGAAKEKEEEEEARLDAALRGLAHLLAEEAARREEEDEAASDLWRALGSDAKLLADCAALANFLDTRACIPRDMGAPSAASLKSLAARLQLACEDGD